MGEGRFVCLTIAAMLLLPACASTTAIPVSPQDQTTPGIRVYDKKPLLFVYENAATVDFIPNYSRGYALQFTAFLAKNDVKTVYENGSLKSLDTNLDSTEALKLIQALAEKLLGAAFPAEAPRTSGGAAGAGALLAVYDFEFSEDGSLVRLVRIDDGRLPKPRPLPPVINNAPAAGSSGPPVSNKS